MIKTSTRLCCFYKGRSLTKRMFFCASIGTMMTLMLPLTTTLTMTSCGGKTEQKTDSVPNYELQTLKRVDQQVTYQFPALLKGGNDVQIFPQAEGRITGIYYENGDLVQKGQKLFTIQSSQQQNNVRTDAASVQAAQATVNSAKLKLDSEKKLYDKGIVSEFVYRTAQNEYTTALAQLAQAKAQLNNAKTNLGYCTVTSPITGVVSGRDFNVGALVSPNMTTPLTTVSSQSLIIAQFSIPENIFAGVIQRAGLMMTPTGYRTKDGKTIDDFMTYELIMSTGEKYGQKGHFRSMSGMVDNETGTATCYINFNNPQGLLHSGNSATIVIPMQEKGVFVIPQSACKRLQNKYLLYKVGKDNKAESIIVDVYPTDDGQHYIVYSKDLKEGDEILKTGVAKVTDGMKLK